MTGEPRGTHCVYTILNREFIAETLDGDGAGEFTEGQRWASANKYLEALDEAEPYPLLLGDAATTAGVEWVAIVESIELLEDGDTRVHFSSLAELGQSIPLGALLKASDGKALSPKYIRPYVPCVVTGETEELVLATLRRRLIGEPVDAFSVIGRKTAGDFADALRSIQSSITSNQRAMLVGHAAAPGQTLSMLALAGLGGYAKFESANMQYGMLGRKFAQFFEIEGLPNQTQAIAWNEGTRDELGHFTWKLRRPLVEALYELGWAARPTPEGFIIEAAAREIDADPKCAGVSATVRLALVEARIGQGGYRKKLIEIWDGRCALTGCSLSQVLVASHAKPWSDSSNDERLDGYNGLLLAAHVDKLFDSGLISFNDDGQLLREDELDDDALLLLGIPLDAKLRFVAPRHIPYLVSHRQRFGFTE